MMNTIESCENDRTKFSLPKSPNILSARATSLPQIAVLTVTVLTSDVQGQYP